MGEDQNHFDPELVDAFLAVEEEFVAIAKQFADDDTPGEGDDE